jgi:hypothetical protein
LDIKLPRVAYATGSYAKESAARGCKIVIAL